MKWKAYEMKNGWQPWFAWYPVKTEEKKWIWLSKTWRFFEVIWDGYWVYSDRPDFESYVFAYTLNEDGTRVPRP